MVGVPPFPPVPAVPVSPSAPAARRTNAERSAATQTRLLDATIDCLVELGWAATSTTEVVRRAGVSRGAQVHHYPTKEDLVLAALDHLLTRRIEEFEATFARLPADERTPGAAMRLLYEHCFRDTFAAWVELVVASRTDPALHERFVQVEKRFFDNALVTFRAMFPDAAADQSFARVALQLAFSVLDGLALNRIIGVGADELDMVLETFNAIAAPYFPHTPGGSS
jgi:AcrR family transcriptional regulator